MRKVVELQFQYYQKLAEEHAILEAVYLVSTHHLICAVALQRTD